MTTVVDPAGTPAPVYNRSGTTIAALTAAVLPTPIVRAAGCTVVLVDNGGSTSNGAELPSDAEIGDIVEAYVIASGGSFVLHPDSGSSFNIGPSVFVNAGVVVRKTAATVWSVMSDI